MAKFRKLPGLSDEERQFLLADLCFALSTLKTPQEAAEFLKDLLGPQEAEMLAKRVKIAELLIEGRSYADIRRALKAGPGTIARVSEWLGVSGEGYRLIVPRLRNKPAYLKSGKISLEEVYNPNSWRNLKRRYPMAFWPQLLIDELIRTANKRQRQKISATLAKMRTKPKLYRDIEKAFKQAGWDTA